MYANQFGQYQKEQYTSNNQGKLIIMMYEGAIKFIEEALKGIRNKDIGARGYYLSRADKIVAELNLTLDIQKGGEVAKNLSRLYTFIRQQILVSNCKGEEKPLIDTLEILVDLKGAWNQIVKGSVANKPTLPVKKPEGSVAPTERKRFAVTAY